MSDEIERLLKRLEREKSARIQAEKMLEEKSREIFALNEQISQKLRLFEAAIVNARDAVIITTASLDNPGPEIIYVNESFTRISGYTAEEVIGKTPRMLQGRDTDKKTLAALKQALQNGQPFTGELKNYTKQGKAYWLEISIIPVLNEQGIITHFAAIERDITPRKAFEKELTITREAAEVANRAKSDFLANMSHELRTPMNGIIGLTELLLESSQDADQQELVSAVHMSSQNLLIMLNDILDLSKIEAGELTLEHIPYDIRKVVEQTMSILGHIASRKGITLEKNISPLIPDRLMGDPVRMQQVLNNLISNAIKFTDKGRVYLDITAQKEKDGKNMLHIRVEDTGIGIAEEKQELIFSKFTQADVSTARKYGGTGLGLTITRELIEIMNGNIGLASIVGRGTTFFVSMPMEIAVTKESSVMPITDPHQITSFTHDHTRILIVDDHPVNLLFLRKALQKLGLIQIDEARGGKEAVELVQKNTYNLIFMDCQMPEMDGFEAAAYIREFESFANQIKIIAVTADAMKGARERCIDSGMNDYISKPVSIDKLKGVLTEWLPAIPHQEASDTPLSKPLSSSPIMDWERLHSFTDGNKDEEKQLIDMFITYAKETLAELQEALDDTQKIEWKKAAHKFKGSAANLGAVRLSESCFVAEKEFEQNMAAKKTMLIDIQNMYSEVKVELLSVK